MDPGILLTLTIHQATATTLLNYRLQLQKILKFSQDKNR